MEAHRSGKDSVRKAIIDTNVLMYIFTKKVDVFTQLRELGFKKFVFPRHVVEELERLQVSLDGTERRAARFALTLIRSRDDCEVHEVDAVGSDNAILKLAKSLDAAVITNDKALRKRAKLEGIVVGYLRELKYVELDEDY
ncbi:MAG: ribonuclease VapC [Archaeoglobi archaeon]|nr:ribonuclease VapC [Archaeoglobi archaeon]